MAHKSEKKPLPDPPKARPTDEQLIDRHRIDVKELDARGYLPNQIASVLRIPYRIVEAVLSTKTPPKKKRSE